MSQSDPFEEMARRAIPGEYNVLLYENEEGNCIFKNGHTFTEDVPEEAKEYTKERIKRELGKILIDEILKADKPLVVKGVEKSEEIEDPKRFKDVEEYKLEFCLYQLVRR